VSRGAVRFRRVRPAAGETHGLLGTVVGDLDTAEEDFAAAADVHARLHAPAFLAHTQVEWAGALRRRNRPQDSSSAQVLLAEAAATAGDLGLRSLLQRIDTLMN
jgi:hypothetical protein